MGLFFRKKKKEEILESAPRETVNVSQEEKETVAKKAPAVVSNEIPAKIVAVIAAAVTYTLGAGVKVLSVRRAENGRGRSPWSMAGLLENTRPF